MSHYLNQRCSRYRDLPQFPEVAPDPSVRNTKQVGTVSSDFRGAHEAEQEEEEDEDEDEEDFYTDEDEESEEEEGEEHESGEAEVGCELF